MFAIIQANQQYKSNVKYELVQRIVFHRENSCRTENTMSNICSNNVMYVPTCLFNLAK